MKSANILNPHVELYKKEEHLTHVTFPTTHTRTTKTRTAWHWSYTLFVVCCLFCGKVKILQKGNGKPVWVDIYERRVVQFFLKRVILISLAYYPFCVVSVRKTFQLESLTEEWWRNYNDTSIIQFLWIH